MIDTQELEDKFNADEECSTGQKFFPAPEIEKEAIKLIDRFHPHLKEAKIHYMFRDGKWNKNDRPVPGEVKLMSPYQSALTGLDFGIVINYKNWLKITSPELHEAILDHLLSFCYYTEDKKGGIKWKKISPSIHEFPEIISRHGAYCVEVSELEDSLKEFSKG